MEQNDPYLIMCFFLFIKKELSMKVKIFWLLNGVKQIYNLHEKESTLAKKQKKWGQKVKFPYLSAPNFLLSCQDVQ